MRPRLDPRRVAVARLGDEAVLFDQRSYRATRANAVAACAVGLCDGRHTVAALARALGARFGIAPRQARGDLRRLLVALERRGFLAPAKRR